MEIQASICVITYQHEDYISDTIEGILNQKVDFGYEVVVGEDYSKDKTRLRCEHYRDNFPTLIKLLPSERNYGMMGNFNRTLAACKGKYIALCEGDDYWIDPNKLQMQVDFMEANPDFSMCFTDAEVVNEMNQPMPNPFSKVPGDVLTLEDFVMTERVFAPTATLLFRNTLPDPLPRFQQEAISGDIALHLIMATQGKVKYLPVKTAVYRHHSGGVTKSEAHKRAGYERLFKLYEDANAYFDYQYNAIFRKRLSTMAKTLLIWGSRDLKGGEKVKYVLAHSKKYFRYARPLQLKELLYYTLVLFFPGLLRKIANGKVTDVNIP